MRDHPPSAPPAPENAHRLLLECADRLRRQVRIDIESAARGCYPDLGTLGADDRAWIGPQLAILCRVEAFAGRPDGAWPAWLDYAIAYGLPPAEAT